MPRHKKAVCTPWPHFACNTPSYRAVWVSLCFPAVSKTAPLLTLSPRGWWCLVAGLWLKDGDLWVRGDCSHPLSPCIATTGRASKELFLPLLPF